MCEKRWPAQMRIVHMCECLCRYILCWRSKCYIVKQSEKDATETFLFSNLSMWESFICCSLAHRMHLGMFESLENTVVNSYVTVVHRSLLLSIHFSLRFVSFFFHIFLDEKGPSYWDREWKKEQCIVSLSVREPQTDYDWKYFGIFVEREIQNVYAFECCALRASLRHSRFHMLPYWLIVRTST